MSNVLSEEKKQQVIALGKLGWPLRRIEQATGVRRETASAYLKSAGVVVCLPGWGRRAPAKPAIRVTTDSEAKPATVTPDFIAPFSEKPELGLRSGDGHVHRPPRRCTFPRPTRHRQKPCGTGHRASGPPCWTASSTTAISSNVGRGVGEPKWACLIRSKRDKKDYVPGHLTWPVLK